MTVSAWPLDAVNGAPTYSGRVLRQTTNAPWLSGATAARPLGAFSGVRPGTSTTTVTAPSATSWACAPVAGVIDGETAAEAGPYAFASDATVTGSITAANASNPRVDIIYVQVSDPAEADGSAAPGVKIDYLAGNPASTPTAPAAPSRSFVLAQINVPKSGGGNPSVTWVAPYLAAAGARPQVATVAMLPGAGATSRIDVYGDTAARNGTYAWTGTAWSQVSTNGWVPFAPVFLNMSGSVHNRARYRIDHEEITIDTLTTLSNGGTFGDVQLQLPFPTPPSWSSLETPKGGAQWFDVSAGSVGRFTAASYFLTSTQLRFGTLSTNGLLTAGPPFTAAGGDQLRIYVSYPLT